ncbi:glycosyltransferase family 4 protein [Pimelobacter sp. 30-1]|uniref:glycosyltransferase family 4 protein n=1 Tax=Pimelobacter sp. 30-1 TaxID=2004991 RepID=UPI001C045327|nr:glycosyltransferase family 4 protein [Pimelobacter sp. 30-1]
MASDSSRGRVVVLVHTRLGADSRVIKQVRSMQDRGWDVVAVAVGNASKDVDLHGASIVAVDPGKTLRQPRSAFRSPLVRSPLAYSSRGKPRYLAAWHRARLGDLRYRVDAVRAAQPPATGLRVAALRGRALAAKARVAIADRRLQATDDLISQRRKAEGRVDALASTAWQRVLGDGAWRRLWPEAYEQELVYGPVIDSLAPDIIHANDFMMLAVAARAKLRARAQGRDVKVLWDVREYLRGMSPWSPHPRWKPAHVSMESEFAPYADAVVTVSEPLADLIIADHHLTERPAIVLNAPVITDPPITCDTDVRRECGLAADVPLVVYSGGAAPQRGLEVMVEALPDLPGTHTAFVVLQPGVTDLPPYVQGLADRAAELGVADRVHFLSYVPSEQVVAFLSTADIGVFPGLPFLNHQISLITKFLEYSHARLPIVVSNLKTMAETVRATGQGEVFECEDPVTYASAIRKVLADRASYLPAYDDAERMEAWAWEAQAVALDRVYASMMEGRHV